MTGLSDGEDITLDYEVMEDIYDDTLDCVKRDTGRKSKALFERVYGPVSIFTYLELEEIEQQWPYMNALDIEERPRFRETLDRDEWSGNLNVEVSMPDPAWKYSNRDHAKKWHQEPYEEPREPARDTWMTIQGGLSGWKAFFDQRQQQS